VDQLSPGSQGAPEEQAYKEQQQQAADDGQWEDDG
jgi:hypothetical protein